MIESRSNAKIKKLAALATKKGRREYGEFLIEGLHMVKEAVRFEVPLVEIFVSSGAKNIVLPQISKAKCAVTEVLDAVFERVANTENTQGVIAVAKIPQEEPLFAASKFLILDRISDPGNMGTILRTAAATGFVDVVTIDCVDVFNPKVVRSSSSGLFFVKIHTKTEQEVLEIAKTHNILSATAEGENVFEMHDFPANFGLVVGNEANGVSENIKKSSRLVALPMSDKVESLNAAVSASVLMYFFANMR